MRLIDGDELLSSMRSECYGDCNWCYHFNSETDYNCGLVLYAPKIDPVKHGYWIGNEDIVDPRYPHTVRFGFGYGQCSVCKGIVWLAVTRSGNMKYCPECGAKMDEVEV